MDCYTCVAAERPEAWSTTANIQPINFTSIWQKTMASLSRDRLIESRSVWLFASCELS